MCSELLKFICFEWNAVEAVHQTLWNRVELGGFDRYKIDDILSSVPGQF
jgi:hypothetical protein